MAQPILTNLDNGVFTITFNRPDKKNAISNEMYEMMTAGIQEAAGEKQARVVLFNANGDDFTSGNDLKDFAAVNRGELDLDALPVVKFIESMLSFEKPVVAAVKGLAVGIGTTMLFHCDAVIGGASANFHLPFAQLGLVPEFACSQLLPAAAGKVRATHILMLGEPFGCEEAVRMGMVSRPCADENVDQEAIKVSRQIAAMPPATMREVKRLINPPAFKEQLVETVKRESAVFARALQSEEHREALSAFFEKRRPDFSRFD